MQFTSLANSKLHFVGNKAKGRISKRVFQDNKARQIFRKTNISYPLVRTFTCAYQGVRNVCKSGGTKCLFFGKSGSSMLKIILFMFHWKSDSDIITKANS